MRRTVAPPGDSNFNRMKSEVVKLLWRKTGALEAQAVTHSNCFRNSAGALPTELRTYLCGGDGWIRTTVSFGTWVTARRNQPLCHIP